MFCLALLAWTNGVVAQYPAAYKGAPYSGAPLSGRPQTIPGRVYTGYYDDGGEGVAYHDNDSANQGVPWGNFRPAGGVDVEWTKEDDYWADSMGNKNVPQHVYLIGWTGTGEWVNFTVNVQTAGLYNVGGMVSKDQGRIVRNFVLDNRDTIGMFDVAATGYRHLWRYYPNMVSIPLPAGKHLLKVYELGEGNMQYFDFTLKGAGVAFPAERRAGFPNGIQASFGNGTISVRYDARCSENVEFRLYMPDGGCVTSNSSLCVPGRNCLKMNVEHLRGGVYIYSILGSSGNATGLVRVIR
jgi:hypothetical protein